MAIRFQLPWRVERQADPVVLGQQAMAKVMRGLLTQTPAQSAQAGWPSSMVPPAVSAYHWDFPWQYTSPQSPRQQPGKQIDVGSLRQLAEMYDPLRSCILHLKREVRATPLRVQPRDPKAKISERSLQEATDWFGLRGGTGGFGRPRSEFEDAMFEDLLVVGAAAVYHQRSRIGRPYADIAIDAATIRPWVSAYGWSDPDKAYEQWVQGMVVASFSIDELTYRGLHSKTHTPYYSSPIEWLLSAILSGIKSDEWNLSWLTDGTTVSDIMALPETWTPEHVKAWWIMWDAMLSGNAKARAKTKFVPGGTQRVSSSARKDQDFETFQLWMMRRTCSIMGVQPASIGFAGEQYKVSQEGSMDQTSTFGVGGLLDYRKELYDDALARLGYPDLEAINYTAKEEKGTEKAQRLSLAVGKPWKTANEARKEDGLDPLDDPEADTLGAPAAPAAPSDPPAKGDAKAKPTEQKRSDALRLWERKAIARVKDGRPASCPFMHAALDETDLETVSARLAECESVDDVRLAFRAAAIAGRVMRRVSRAAFDAD